MNRERIVILVVFLTLWFSGSSLFGQEGEAGIESPFSIGVGARALGLGSASVAFPNDPSAFTWNPAGMVVVQQKGLSLSLTTLFEGTQYNFIGYVHPTISVGTFGLGVSRIGTGGIKYTEDVGGVPVDLGELNYWWGKLSFAYAVTIIQGFSVGVNCNVNRQVLGFYSTHGFGVDVGFHYGVPAKRGILKGLYFGCNLENALTPRLKLGVSTETIPYKLRVGMAKVFNLRNDADHWLLLADFEQGEHQTYRYHVGMEYGVGGLFFLRAGYNNGELSFGGGLRYWNFQVDYATSRIADPAFFPRSHRFSLIFYIGKSIPEQKRILEEARRQEVQEKIQERVDSDRQRRISEGLQSGREYLEKGDYFNARLEFSRVLREDSENLVAQELLSETTKQEEVLQRQHEVELLADAKEKEKIQRDNAYINQRLTEGNEAMEQGDFQKAIDKWQQALERDPTNSRIYNNVELAKTELENEITRSIARGRQLVREKNYSEAYKVLNRAKEQTAGNPELTGKIVLEIQRIDRWVEFITNFQEGQQRYSQGDYEAAARYLEKALTIIPDYERAKELHRNAVARSMGTKQEMTGEAKVLWESGLGFYIDGRYEEAIKIWEEALKIDPHNVEILKNIEQAQKKINTYKKKK